MIEISHLSKTFSSRKGMIKAVDDVSLIIEPHLTLAIVGESGCGKTTLARTIMGMYQSDRGSVKYNGEELNTILKHKARDFYRYAQMIFQDPYSCLDPRMNVKSIILEGRRSLYKDTNDVLDHMAAQLLEQVGLSSQFLSRYPHELSGGQRQRIGIARALALEPQFIVLDEPTAALDVSIQAQVINLLMKLQQEKGLTYLLISHNLAVVRHISDRIAIMYLGAIVEVSETDELFLHPLHPYTQLLLASAFQTDTIIIKGEVSDSYHHMGCPFAPRCHKATEHCFNKKPLLKEVMDQHQVACHLYKESE